MKRLLLVCAVAFFLTSCGEHSGYNVTKFTGEYRYYSGIAEFFDCKEHTKYYVAQAGINTDLQEKYLKLGLKRNDDVYIQVKGYLKEDKQMDGVDPIIVFVPVEFISFDKNRGCQRSGKRGG